MISSDIKTELKIKAIMLTTVLAVLAVIVTAIWAWRVSDARLAADDVLVQAKYAQWIAYRDANCKPVEKMLGIHMQSGKFSSIDNATRYLCNNGMAYTISQNAENDVKAHKGNLDFIPEPEKD